VIERETKLVRAGKLREAMASEPEKSALSRRYVSAVGHLKASQKFLAQSAPELLTTLHRYHDTFRAMRTAAHDAALGQPIALTNTL
jgi:hypothetical protein